MKNNSLLYLFCLLIFSTCSGLPASPPVSSVNVSETSFFSSFPSNGGLVFIGVAGKRSNPNETLQLALEDAAHRVAVFNKVSGEYVVENNIGSGAFDHLHNTRTQLFADKEQSKQYVDALQYDADTDTIEIENSFFIRTVYRSPLPSPVNYRSGYTGADRKPDWIDKPPNEIEGYEVGIGFSGRYSSITDTFTNSWNNAVFAIIRNINATSQSNDLLYQNTGSLFGYKTSNDNTVYSFGTLSYFYVLDTWIDPKSKSVWTLAIAKKSE
ncbi:MAG: hypothetical protein LBI04_10400 [Treponema sp.]|nr:hypothetical protein [Treponema sp.]